MRVDTAYLVLSTLATAASAAPQPRGIYANALTSQNSTATVPQKITDPEKLAAREAAVLARRNGYGYGPSLIGDKAAPFPNGPKGDALWKADYALWETDRAVIEKAYAADTEVAKEAIIANGGLNTIDDWAEVLYTDQWKNANPRGTAPGIMENWRDDLLFSMERLSQNPYSLALVDPDGDLPFEIDDDTTKSIAGATLNELKSAKSLFYVDYSSQSELDKTTLDPPRFGASCSAYFYIDPESQDFLPLAIKTNHEEDLVYLRHIEGNDKTDTEEDWLLAKMMFNVNDMFHSQMLHLVITHDVSEAVHQAALHTLAEDHPVMVILDRLMLQAYSSRVVGEELCFNPGGNWDKLMHVNNEGCREFVNEEWPVAGKFQSGYFENNLKARGLLNDDGETPFKSFPFFQDASKIHDGYREFFKSFVDSYYDSDEDLSEDYEIQNWFVEASTKNASVQDFPQVNLPDEHATKETLVEVLTHFGFIVSVGHHALNGGDPVGSKATLPFHLPALYAPVPKEKGVKDLVPFLPPAENAVYYIAFIASFNRPFYETSERTLEYAFSETGVLNRLNKATKEAAETFFSSMQSLSDEIRDRTLDEDGLSLGMPFVYRTLDPGYIPFFSAV